MSLVNWESTTIKVNLCLGCHDPALALLRSSTPFFAMVFIQGAHPLKTPRAFSVCCVVGQFSSVNQLTTDNTQQGTARNEHSGAGRSTGSCRIQLAFWAASAHCQLTANFWLFWLLPIHWSPVCIDIGYYPDPSAGPCTWPRWTSQGSHGPTPQGCQDPSGRHPFSKTIFIVWNFLSLSFQWIISCWASSPNQLNLQVHHHSIWQVIFHTEGNQNRKMRRK